MITAKLIIPEPGSDFSQVSRKPIVFERSAGSTSIRRMCFTLSLSLDGVYENTESLAFDLAFDQTTTGFFDPTSTRIFILDSDGKVKEDVVKY